MSHHPSPEEERKILDNPALPVAKALAKMGYRPESGVFDAAQRMLRTPDLAKTLMMYADAGQPAIDFERSIPGILFTPLPHGYSIAVLVRDFGLKPVGAFLLASDLIIKPEETNALLERILRDGVWITDTDGKRGLFRPRLSTTGVTGGNRAAVSSPAEDVSVQELISVLDEIDSSRTEQVHPEERKGTIVCQACGAQCDLTKQFCPACGKKIPDNPPSHRHCTQCGAEIADGRKFCGKCGAKVR